MISLAMIRPPHFGRQDHSATNRSGGGLAHALATHSRSQRPARAAESTENAAGATSPSCSARAFVAEATEASGSARLQAGVAQEVTGGPCEIGRRMPCTAATASLSTVGRRSSPFHRGNLPDAYGARAIAANGAYRSVL